MHDLIDHVSYSQCHTFDETDEAGCRRKWFLEKREGVPRLVKDYYDFGHDLHECNELGLNGQEPRPRQGWAPILSDRQIQDIKDMVEAAKVWVSDDFPEPLLTGKSIQAGHEETEYFFSVPLGEDLPPIEGYIDLARFLAGEVQDHKTTSSWRYAKGPRALEEDMQMLTYAKVLVNVMREHGYKVPRKIAVVHNTFLKAPRPGRNSGGEGKLRRNRGHVTHAQISANWQKVTVLARDMCELVERVRDWTDVPKPARYPRPCHAYSGCEHQELCEGRCDLEQHVIEITRQNELSQTRNNMGAMEALMGGKSTKKTASKKTTSKKTTSKKTASKKGADGWNTGTPPWANLECVACEGTGYTTKLKEPCRICLSTAEERGAVLPAACDRDKDDAGNPRWRIKTADAGSVNGSLPPEEGTEVEAIAPAKVTPETTRTTATPPTTNVVEPALVKDKPKSRAGRKPLSYLLVVNVPVWNSGKREVVELHDMLWKGTLGATIAEGFGEDAYRACDVFKRRDAARCLADSDAVLAELKGKILHVMLSDVESREVFTAFMEQADEIIGSV